MLMAHVHVQRQGNILDVESDFDKSAMCIEIYESLKEMGFEGD